MGIMVIMQSMEIPWEWKLMLRVPAGLDTNVWDCHGDGKNAAGFAQECRPV